MRNKNRCTGYRKSLYPVHFVLSVLVFALWSPVTAQPVAGAGGPHATDGVALKDVPPLPEGTPLFEAEAKFARGRSGGYAMPPCKYAVFPDTKLRREGSQEEPVLIRYRKAPNPSFVGAYIVVLGDLSRFATMSFWVKGDQGGEAFEVGINDTISNKREDAIIVGSIYRYLPHGVSKEWQQVIIPMEDFFGADLARVYSIVFNFNEEGEGKFWVDGLAFHQEQMVDRENDIQIKGELLLDNFDHSDVNLLGRKANTYKRLLSACEFTRVENPRRGKHGRSLKLDFDKQPGGWCGYYTLLNQIDGAYFDLTPYKEVRFWVLGAQGGEVFDIGMADRSWMTIGDSVKVGPSEKYLKGGVRKKWQEVVIPLKDFGKLDWSQMGSFVVNFPKPGTGTLFIEDLRFIRKSDEDLLNEWGDE